MGKREDILTATLDLITEEGLQSVTFSKIFTKANVGSSTFYHYFSNKEDVVSEVFVNARAHMGEFILKEYDDTLTTYEKMKAILFNMAEFGFSHPHEMLLIDNYCDSPFIPEEIRKQPVPADEIILKIIIEGQKHGIVRDMDPIFSCHIVIGIITSVIKGDLTGKFLLDENKIKQTVEICWKAIKV
ncbi:TetR/AcrR family transcriptional regulator [Amphibacillus cookii]|uniref:TetR/AcrR family transcriptional regulator n=1 Tax=Amphibacillus cookii TaxID=767787 RepID=UPI001959C4D6|nr:TetR/AcrR family transcriptional regulator [Amphibacillus cookii]MBM7541933.1 AcrR family transcriptional regulator [Amphibacillus cookii]